MYNTLLRQLLAVCLFHFPYINSIYCEHSYYHVVCFLFDSQLTLKTQKILLYFWVAGMVSHLFLVVEMTGLPCVRRFGIYQNDEKGYNEKTLLMSSRVLQLIRSFGFKK